MNKVKQNRYQDALEIDYKNPKIIKYITENGKKIISKRITSSRSFLQRKLSREIKYARFLAILPYCDKQF